MTYFQQWRKRHNPILKAVLVLARRKKVVPYLVGGAVRDLYLKREKGIPDFDFCMAHGALAFGRQLAREISAGYVVLDDEHNCCRVVVRNEGGGYTLDFADFRKPDLTDDLRHRDFTLNSMAVELSALLSAATIDACVIDPYAGRRAIREKQVIVVDKKAFDEDPLRLLRAFSMQAVFGFRIEHRTRALIAAKQKKIAMAAGERVRDELFKILASCRAHETVLDLDSSGLLQRLLPEIKPMRSLDQGPYHHLDVWNHSLTTLRNVEQILETVQKNADLRAYSMQEVSSGRRRFDLIKLAALLHDVGKPATLKFEGKKVSFHGHERVGSALVRDIGGRLKLSNEEVRALRQIVFTHLRPGYLADHRILTPRAKFRFFRDTAPETVSVLLVSLADQRATRGRLTTPGSRKAHESLVRRLIREHFKKQKEKPLPRQINGNDVMRLLTIEPSPLVGKILAELDELQAIGKITNKKEASAAAKKLYARQKNTA